MRFLSCLTERAAFLASLGFLVFLSFPRDITAYEDGTLRAQEQDENRLVGHWRFQGDEEAIDFEVEADGRYILTVRTPDGTEVTRGTWRIAGRRLTLHADGEEEEAVVFRCRFKGADVLEVSHPEEGTYRLHRTMEGKAQRPAAKAGEDDGRPDTEPAPPAPRGKEGRIPSLPPSPTGHIVYTRWGKRRVEGGGLHEEIPLPQLWVMNGDGTDKRPFFAPKEGFVIAKEARWSPDYDEIAFISNFRSGRSACMEDIFIAKADGSAPFRVTGNEMRAVVPPAYGAVTGVIVDNMRTLEQVGRSYTQINITAQGAGGMIVHPSPASEMEVRSEAGMKLGKLRAWRFTLPKVMAGSKVWIKIWVDKYVGTLRIVNVKAGQVNDIGNIELNNGLYYASSPSLSRDRRYVFGIGSIASLQENPKGLATPGGADNVCVYDRKTGRVAAMFEPTRMRGENAKFPAVSPDGRFLAVCWGVEGMENLALLTVTEFLANRARPRVLVPGERLLFQATLKGAASPAWSPDGKRIVFARSTMTTQYVTANIAAVNADGSGLRMLTKVGPNQLCTHPCFSPDGRRIAFSVLTGKHGLISPADMVTYQFTADLYTMNADGSNLRRITNDGISVEPAWGP